MEIRYFCSSGGGRRRGGHHRTSERARSRGLMKGGGHRNERLKKLLCWAPRFACDGSCCPTRDLSSLKPGLRRWEVSQVGSSDGQGSLFNLCGPDTTTWASQWSSKEREKDHFLKSSGYYLDFCLCFFFLSFLLFNFWFLCFIMGIVQ